MPDKPEIERLRGVQERRAKQEGEEAERASEPRGAHERRADKAAYLRETQHSIPPSVICH